MSSGPFLESTEILGFQAAPLVTAKGAGKCTRHLALGKVEVGLAELVFYSLTKVKRAIGY